MDTLFCIRAFIRVVEHGAFIRAADDLGVSRSTLTTAVARLEKRLGVRLMHRTTRRVSLTEEGGQYYEACLRIIGDLDEVEDSLTSLRAVPRGRLRVSVSHGFANVVLFPALPAFIARYPALELEVVVSDRSVNLIEEGIDCAVRAVALDDDANLVARRISDIRWVTCATAGYLGREGRPGSIEDLASHNCIASVSPTTVRSVDWSFSIDGRILRFTPRGNLRVTSLEAAVSAAAAGIGIAQIPEPLVHGAVREGRLELLLPEAMAPAPAVHVVYPRNRYLSAKVRAFIDFVSEVDPVREAELRLA